MTECAVLKDTCLLCALMVCIYYCCFRLVYMQYLRSHYTSVAVSLTLFCGTMHQRFVYYCFLLMHINMSAVQRAQC